jgi:hypothetical protein
VTITGPRRVCPWHLLDLVEGEGGELACVGHSPRAWLVLAEDRLVAAGAVGAEVALIIHPPISLDAYITGPWLRLRAPAATFGVGARLARVPAAVRHALASRRKSPESLDVLQRAAGACEP